VTPAIFWYPGGGLLGEQAEGFFSPKNTSFKLSARLRLAPIFAGTDSFLRTEGIPCSVGDLELSSVFSAFFLLVDGMLRLRGLGAFPLRDRFPLIRSQARRRKPGCGLLSSSLVPGWLVSARRSREKLYAEA